MPLTVVKVTTGDEVILDTAIDQAVELLGRGNTTSSGLIRLIDHEGAVVYINPASVVIAREYSG